ncbi:MAG TPA: hypothetical protein VIQ51_05555 [Chryseosolibacter sp.]|jgi:hypothetical protein
MMLIAVMRIKSLQIILNLLLVFLLLNFSIDPLDKSGREDLLKSLLGSVPGEPLL